VRPRDGGRGAARAAPAPRDRGSGLVAGIVLIFAFTFLGLVWLARDVDRGVSNRSAAQSIAFQAARSGAQAVSIPALRGQWDAALLDEAGARRAAERTAVALFTSYGVAGKITSIEVADDMVSVAVAITDGSITVTGAGTVRAERAP
jgi:hypothetical protein